MCFTGASRLASPFHLKAQAVANSQIPMPARAATSSQVDTGEPLPYRPGTSEASPDAESAISRLLRLAGVNCLV